MSKHLRFLNKIGKCKNIDYKKKNNVLFCIMYKFHNSYFVFFVIFVYIYLYIFIYLWRSISLNLNALLLGFTFFPPGIWPEPSWRWPKNRHRWLHPRRPGLHEAQNSVPQLRRAFGASAPKARCSALVYQHKVKNKINHWK